MINAVTVSFVAGSAYSIYNGFEKYILEILKVNLNTYFVYRYIAILIFISGIYFIYKRDDKRILKLDNPKIETNKLLILIFITAFMVVFSDYVTSYGLQRYSISEFSFMVILFIMICNLIIGLFIFNEQLSKRQIIGVVLAIISVNLIKNNSFIPRNRYYNVFIDKINKSIGI